MAVIKQRLLRKNSSNEYDTIHLETSTDAITGTLPTTKGGTGRSFPDISALRYYMGGYNSVLDAPGWRPCKIVYPFIAKGSYVGLTYTDDWVVYEVSRYELKIFAMFISKTDVRAMPASNTTGKFDIDTSAIAQACEECESNYDAAVLDMLVKDITGTGKRFTVLSSYEIKDNAVLRNPYHRVVDNKPYWLDSGIANGAEYMNASGTTSYTSNMAQTCNLRLATTIKIS